MSATSFLLICVTILLPVIIAFSYIFSKVIQTPLNNPRRVKRITTKEHARLFYEAFILPKRIKPFPLDTHTMNRKLQNNQRKWLQIGRLENEMKHFKARYKRFKEYSQAMPSEDIEISTKVTSQELKKYKALRKKLIRQALMSSDKVNISSKNNVCDDYDYETEPLTFEEYDCYLFK